MRIGVEAERRRDLRPNKVDGATQGGVRKQYARAKLVAWLFLVSITVAVCGGSRVDGAVMPTGIDGPEARALKDAHVWLNGQLLSQAEKDSGLFPFTGQPLGRGILYAHAGGYSPFFSEVNLKDNGETLEARMEPLANAGKITFTSIVDGSEQVFIMNSDRSAQTALTEGSARNVHPVWSPEKTWIAFASDRDGNFEIYVMRPDGSEQRRLTFDEAEDAVPIWSPDGRRIAFMRGIGDEAEIYIVNVDGSSLTRLTNDRAWD